MCCALTRMGVIVCVVVSSKENGLPKGTGQDQRPDQSHGFGRERAWFPRVYGSVSTSTPSLPPSLSHTSAPNSSLTLGYLSWWMGERIDPTLLLSDQLTPSVPRRGTLVSRMTSTFMIPYVIISLLTNNFISTAMFLKICLQLNVAYLAGLVPTKSDLESSNTNSAIVGYSSQSMVSFPPYPLVLITYIASQTPCDSIRWYWASDRWYSFHRWGLLRECHLDSRYCVEGYHRTLDQLWWSYVLSISHPSVRFWGKLRWLILNDKLPDSVPVTIVWNPSESIFYLTANPSAFITANPGATIAVRSLFLLAIVIKTYSTLFVVII